MAHMPLIVVSLMSSQPFKSFANLQGLSKGDTAKGISELKRYLNRFGYLNLDQATLNDVVDDRFDDALESALKLYQKYFNLEITGKIDSDTIKQMMLPRCGLPDVVHRIPYKKLIEFETNKVRA
ncbi:hypothetical protein FEM48_Zijuj04G0143100 [Ziziphus jujuba var. spinosa]|uniref:Peptidoglycan binding-like domain-containing protein n=1 Tax=Ziziphus jujuba var. spinosa TaxID=714518 RepID=A0A978VKD2_ZIZJJ|nr:hypothetical protein FEM48_Zijuj04G0143100 [Ziziphus jujuba var. spinosa]